MRRQHDPRGRDRRGRAQQAEKQEKDETKQLRGMPMEGSVHTTHAVRAFQLEQIGGEHYDRGHANYGAHHCFHGMGAQAAPAQLEHTRAVDVVEDQALEHCGHRECQAMRLKTVQPDFLPARRPPRGGDVHDLHDAKKKTRPRVRARARGAHPHRGDSHHGHGCHRHHEVHDVEMCVARNDEFILDFVEGLRGVAHVHISLRDRYGQYLEFVAVDVTLRV
mmetsp:Transcript_100139/g.282575  ORF Transcript_100139/g.282575 Transcript_100139/m.282575 type:complete len:220 (+) Transcript_100139:169-828(+)